MTLPQAVYLCDSIRTPFGRHGGILAGVRTDDLAALPLAELLRRNPGLDPAAVDEVMLGCANQAGEDNRNVARMAALLAGLPPGVAAVTLNRLCGSGLDAIGSAARAIALGEADVMLAGGVESMSRAPYVLAKAGSAWNRQQKLEDSTIGWRFVNPRMQAAWGIDSMAQTAENLAREHRISRADQDAYAWRSQQRAAAAQAQVAEEIMTLRLPARGGEQLVGADEHPRPQTTLEQLAALEPITDAAGSVTAGNASGINDGAAAVLLASSAAVARHGLQPRARVLGLATAGVEPRLMGIGPVPAIGKLLGRHTLSLDQIGVIEINEAFAAQVLACSRALGLADDAARLNGQGGAIAFGHPLGASGARLVGTALRQMGKGNARYALCAMCVGVGQGIALLMESVA